MRKLVALRMEEAARDDLKLMALLEKKNMGELLEEMIRERMERMQRVSRSLPVARPETEKQLEGKNKEKSRGY